MGGLLPFFETEDPGTDFLDFQKVLSYSSNQAFWRATSEGPVKAVVSASLASNSFRTLEGVAPSLELLVTALLPCFRSLMGNFDFETLRRLFLLWSRLIGLIRVSVGSLSNSLLDLLTGLWGTWGRLLQF